MTVTPQNIRQAHQEMSGAVLRTPSVSSYALAQITGAPFYLKLENQQITSSFKPRGAFTRISALDHDQRKKGVITMSAGNHAQAVAYHASRMGIPAVIVMPSQTPFTKVNRTRAWGAEIALEGRNLNECEGTVEKIMQERGLTLIHPYDDELVVTGQGSVGLEMLEDNPDIDTLIVPIGGGGLISGIATIARDINPSIKIYGVQTEAWPNMASAIAGQELKGGGATLAEGIAVKKPGKVTMPIVKNLVDEILLISEDMIEAAVAFLVEQQRIVVEGAGAAGIAAVMQHPDYFKGRHCGAVICGGNIDARLLAAVMTRTMAKDGRIARIRIDITDEPGMLASITAAIGDCKGNIVEIFHQRMFHDVPAKLAKIDAVIETRGGGHIDEIIKALKERGFSVKILSDTAK